MSDDIEYVRISTDACIATGCAGMLHSDRMCVHYRCPVCHETYTRLGMRFVADTSIPRAIVIQREPK